FSLAWSGGERDSRDCAAAEEAATSRRSRTGPIFIRTLQHRNEIAGSRLSQRRCLRINSEEAERYRASRPRQRRRRGHDISCPTRSAELEFACRWGRGNHTLGGPLEPMTMKSGKAGKSVAAGKGHKVLVIDVGGTNIKMLATGEKEARKIPSGPTMTAGKMVRVVKEGVKDWEFDRVSLGYPGPIINGHPLSEPHNLGGGWMKFDFSTAFGCPVKILNDAAMQALGSYKGGRMLFLGLGTGLGS